MTDQREPESAPEVPGPDAGARGASPPEAAPAEPAGGEQAESPLERDLASYPLRDPSDDPRWAIRVVQGWLGFTLFSIAFTVALIVLGWFYD